MWMLSLNIFFILFQIDHYRDLPVEYTLDKSNNYCFYISLVYSAAQTATLHFTVVNYYLLSVQKWLYLKTTMVCYVFNFYIVIQSDIEHYFLPILSIVLFVFFHSLSSFSHCILRNRRKITTNKNISCSITVVFKRADLWNIWFEGYKQLFGWVPFFAPPFIATTVIEFAFTMCAIFNTLFYNVFMRKLTVTFCFSSVPPKMAALSHSHVFAYLFCLAGVSAVSNTVSHPLHNTVTL